MDTLLVVLEPSYKGSIIHLEKDPYAPTSIMGCDKRFAHVIWKSIPVLIGFHTSHLGARCLLPISRILHRFDRTFYNSTLVIWELYKKLFVELPSLKQQKHLKIWWVSACWSTSRDQLCLRKIQSAAVGYIRYPISKFTNRTTGFPQDWRKRMYV